jgi:5'(3')-deoxyribonucleotidase
MRVISIALDCDGLLADFLAGALRLVEEVTGKKFDTSAVTERDFPKGLGLSAHEASAVKKAIGARRGFAASLPRYPQARQGVRRLHALGKVFCITTPWESNIWWRAERESWLALHFGIDHVHHATDDDKTCYEADVFVDDNAEHVRAWLAAWPGRTAVLWRTPHNTRETMPQGAHATGSWEELYHIARSAALSPVQQNTDAMGLP